MPHPSTAPLDSKSQGDAQPRAKKQAPGAQCTSPSVVALLPDELLLKVAIFSNDAQLVDDRNFSHPNTQLRSVVVLSTGFHFDTLH